MKKFTRKERAFFKKLGENEYHSSINRSVLPGWVVAILITGGAILIGLYAFQL
ncbi:MAG: hypothetical protein ACOC3W_10060 [Thermodesulfobacteriota bacterium]